MISCTGAVVQEAAPVVSSAAEIAAKLADVNGKVAVCLSTGVSVLWCLALDVVPMYYDITAIMGEYNNIIQEWPGLIQEIQSCSAKVQQAETDVFNLLDKIETCVNTYVSSTPGSSPA